MIAAIVYLPAALLIICMGIREWFMDRKFFREQEKIRRSFLQPEETHVKITKTNDSHRN